MCRRNACAGILLPVGTAEKGPAHQLILFDKGPDRPRLYVSAWRRCPCLIPALKKVDLVGKRRGHACRQQPGAGDLSHRQTSHKQGPGPSVETETSTTREQGRGDDTHCLRLSMFSSRGQQKVQLRHFDMQRQDQGRGPSSLTAAEKDTVIDDMSSSQGGRELKGRSSVTADRKRTGWRLMKANCIDPSFKSWLFKKVESQSRCAADFSLLRGDCNPGDASANGRKPEADTGIKVGVADGWKCSTSTCQAIPTAINYMFTAGCGSLRSPTFLLMSAAHYHI
ncbi:hypothetical protein NQZ68_003851 [Dissostichus eleginoides]|nr:hypothetical protein NQZ68_003851 [Dissostichus eleginoides]